MRHTFFSCDWIGKTVARVVCSPMIDNTRAGVSIVFTDGTQVRFDSGPMYDMLWLTAHPNAPKRVPLARKVLVCGRRTRTEQK